MKNFIQYIGEELDIKDIEGLDSEFIDNSQKYIRKKEGIEPDGNNFIGLANRFVSLISQIDDILLSDENGKRLDTLDMLERKAQVENLIEQSIRKKYLYLIDFIETNSRKEVNFDLSWVSTSQEVVSEVPRLDKKIAVARKDLTVLEDPITSHSISKSKVMDLISMGEGSVSEQILKSADFRKGFENIIGLKKAEEVIELMKEFYGISNKMNWVIPEEMRARVLRNHPETIFRGSESGVWARDPDKLFIIARSVSPVFLIYDSISSLHQILKGSSLQTTDVGLVKKYTRSHIDDLQNFRYGPIARKMYYTFIEKCIDVVQEKFQEKLYRPKIRVDIYVILSRSVGSGGNYTDEEFLEITKSIFSCYKSIKGDLKLIKSLWENSLAKNVIIDIIDDFIIDKIISSYEDSKKKNVDAENEQDDEISDLKNKSVERSLNPETMTQKELHDAIDTALDKEDYELFIKLSKYLKESRVYLQELERINENLKLIKKFRK